MPSPKGPQRGSPESGEQPLGVWEPNATRLVPRGQIEWNGRPRRSYVASVGGAVLATIRRAGYQPTWIVTMQGFQWDVTGERGSTTHNALRIARSPVRGFPSSRDARRAVEEAHRLLPALA